MRDFSHWTPHYVLARLREMLDQRLRPADPWLTRESIGLLDRLLRPQDVMLEFGSGRSTAWFAARVKQITSIEHQGEWFERVKIMLAHLPADRVTLLHHPRDLPDTDADGALYVRVLDRFAPESLDVVLVDGIYRDFCAMGAVDKVRSGGMIAIDNANWYLPSTVVAPNSRRPEQGAESPTWTRFAEQTASWRRIWTCSGVTATLILFKP